MNVFIARIAAAVASAVILWLTGTLGLPVTDDQVAGATAWLTDGLTGLGGFIMLAVYAVGHRVISKWTNPADAATEPKKVANAVGVDPR